MAAGKSSVARMLREKGCALVDADRVAHELYAEDHALVRRIANEFGPHVLDEEGRLNRSRLGRIVFSDPNALENLNRIVHPALNIAMRQRIGSARRIMNRVVVDAALLVEFGVHHEVDFLILVTAPEEIRLERLIARSHLNREDASNRIHAQGSDELKREQADFVIENVGENEALLMAVEQAWEMILTRESLLV